MKALSLTQPWASLVQRREKRLETRSWWTSYRGPLVIHAAKGFPVGCREEVSEPHFAKALNFAAWTDLPRGVGLCVVNLVACVRTTDLQKLEAINFSLPVQELYFGDFSEGRFPWALEWQYDFPEPVPAKGSLGLWDWRIGKALA